MQPPFPDPEEEQKKAAEDFDTVRHAVDVIQRQTYQSIKDLVADGSASMTAEQALEAIDSIRDAILLREYCSDVFGRFVAGDMEAMMALRAMQGKLAQLYGAWEDYAGIPERG